VRKDFPNLKIEDTRIILLEAVDNLLISMPEELGQETTRVLRRKNVDVRFNAVVVNYEDQVVHLKDGIEIPAHTLIWSAGVRASRLLDTLGVEQDRSGRVKILPTLQVPGFDHIFVIGDAAYLAGEDGKPLPMIAPVAIQQAPHAAKNILRLVEQKPLEEFKYRDPGMMATIGRNQAVVHVGGLKIRGFPAWVMWVVVHIYQLIGFRNRLAVLLDWAWSYLFYDRASRIIGPT
jgi:NADH:ubiquinone reductase (H+-translocating)